jgi:hypothetical protein
MSLSAAECKGHIHVVGGGGGGGFYAISPAISSGGDGVVLIQGVALNLGEIFQPVVTLDDSTRSILTFGSAWEEMTVEGMLLLGPASSGGAVVSSLVGWYKQNRISKLKGPVQVSLGGEGLDAYVVGLRMGAADPRLHTQQFSVVVLAAINA